MAVKQRRARPPAKQPAPGNARFFLIALLLPLLAAVAIEAGLRLAGFGNDLALFIPAPENFSDRRLLMVNPDIARRYFIEDRFVPRPLRDFFLRDKPDDSYRIFVMGESATAGFPYPGNLAFSRILQARLADAFPQRTVEVVNVAVTATNTYAMVDFIDEILAQQPDAILVYAGHNEFYGALGAASTISPGRFKPVLQLYLSVRRLRLFQAVEAGLHRLKSTDAASGSPEGANGPGFTLMGRLSDKADIPLEGVVYQRAREQFTANLHALLARSKAAGVPMLIGDLVSNVRDRPPFASIESATQPRALDVFNEAAMLEKEGRHEAARAAFARARDLDALRFRAPGEFNDIIRRVAAEHGQPVVPVQAAFEAASPNGIVGATLMLEHLHPNVEGQFLMSEAFLVAMREHALIAAQWDAKRVQSLAYYRDSWPVSELDRSLGSMRIRRLTDYWPFKPQAEAGQEWPRYLPEGAVDKLAYNVATNRMRLSEARVELARQYQAKGQPGAALREYRSLASDGRWDFQAQLVAAQQLIEAKRYGEALPFLQASLRLKDTRYAREWIDRIAGPRPLKN